MEVRQKTEYPWSGKVDLLVDPAAPLRATLHIRIPGWAKGAPIASALYYYVSEKKAEVPLTVNGQRVEYQEENGYAILTRTWKQGDRISIDFPMPTEKVLADGRVRDDAGRFVFQRGPIVYCLEGPDNRDSLVRDIMVDTGARAEVSYHPTVLGGIDELRVAGVALKRQAGDTALIQTPGAVTAIPYFAWANRGPSEMTVWVPYERAASMPLPFPTIASRSKVSSSIGTPRMLKAINDQYDPKDANDHSMPYFHWWPRRNSTQWVQYDFAAPGTVSSSKVYWFDDGPWGGCRIPASWRLLYLKDGAWVPVHNTAAYEVAKDRYCAVSFDPVTTTALRLEVVLPADNSAGIHEWSVQ
jgi:hypothetical protein